ncbi:aldose epimerase family protein, partial [Leeuwenhoekiella aequorea]
KDEMLKPAAFDTIIDNKKVSLYWIESDNLKAAFTNYGGRIVGLWVPDKNGELTDVVSGMNSIKGFATASEPYFGATIGRVGNRIAKGKFKIDGQEYTTATNNGENALHGGIKGFQYVVWDAEQPDSKTLVLRYKSQHMEEGFPGNLDVKVTYSIIEDNTVKMDYEATTDMKTVVNLTNHAFFNLNGENSGSILNHKLKLFADRFTPVDAGLIPTGELRNVKDTPFDFRNFQTIGARINTENEQLINGKGYDHNFVLNKTKAMGMYQAATVVGDKSGIQMDVFTKEPGIQFYSGNFMEGKNQFKSGVKDAFRTAFALETQHFPDAPNQENFPSII